MSFNKYRLKGAYHYQWYLTEPWYKECIDRMVRFCKGSTLDVGCGDGLLTTKIRENGQEATGIDIEEYAIELAKMYGRGSFIWGNIEHDIDGQWDYMACLNVIEHMDNPEKLKNIIDKNIRKGAIIITNQYLGGSLGEDHRREYDYKELMDFFKKYKPKGFKTEDGLYIGVEIKL